MIPKAESLKREKRKQEKAEKKKWSAYFSFDRKEENKWKSKWEKKKMWKKGEGGVDNGK